MAVCHHSVSNIQNPRLVPQKNKDYKENHIFAFDCVGDETQISLPAVKDYEVIYPWSAPPSDLVAVKISGKDGCLIIKVDDKASDIDPGKCKLEQHGQVKVAGGGEVPNPFFTDY